MSLPIIGRNRRYYRVRFPTINGLKGIDDGSFILEEDQPARNGEPPGVIKPTEFNTGVLFSRARSAYVGTSTLNITNRVYRDLDFFDFIRVQAPGVQFINCGFYGSTAWPNAPLPLVECMGGVDGAVTTSDPWAGLPLFEGCTFRPQRPNYYTDGILGSFVANECSFTRLRNGVTINSADNTKRARAKVESCYFSDLVFWYPIPGNVPILNAGVNIVASGDIRVIGNHMRSTGYRGDDRNFTDPDGVLAGGGLSQLNPSAMDALTQDNGPHANGAGVRVTQTRSIPYSETTVIDSNWFSYGMAGAELMDGPYWFSHNRFRQNGFYRRSNLGQYYIKLSFTTAPNILGLNTNTFEENNQVLTTANGGIQ